MPKIAHVQKLQEENSKLKREIKLLKRQVSKLRKEVSKVDLKHYSHIKDLIEAQDREDQQFSEENKKVQLRKKWECYQCGKGYLRLIILQRLDGIYYLRSCTECNHRTKLQKYTDNVEGIKE